MNPLKKLLDLRYRLKAKKPVFVREDTDKMKSIALKWRRPTGRHSKMKHQFKGSRKMPSPGWRSPLLVRGLTREGLIPVVVHTADELTRINPKSDAIVIGHSVGKRKRVDLLKQIVEKGMELAHHEDPKKTLDALEDAYKGRTSKNKGQQSKEQAPPEKGPSEKQKEENTSKKELKETKKDIMKKGEAV